MTEIKLKQLVLFLLETLVIQNSHNIDALFVYLFNQYIYECYNNSKEKLNIIYDLNILEKFIENNYELLSLDQMSQLLNRYHRFDGYVNLVDEIGLEVDAKINKLALSFAMYISEYKKELNALYNADPNEYYSKGYSKILQ